MDKFLALIEKVLLPPITKMSENVHLKAIRTGMVVIIPMTIIGSFFMLLLNVPIAGYSNFIAPYEQLITIPFRMTVYMMAVYATFGIGCALGKERDLDPVNAGILSLVALFMTMTPINGSVVTTLTESDVTVNINDAITSGWMISMDYLGSAGLFSAIVVSIVAVDIAYYMKKYKIQFKFPGTIPEAVADSFSAILPTAVVMMLFFMIMTIFGINIHSVINMILSPFQSLITGTGVFGVLFIVVVITLLWSAGIHGVAVVGGIFRPFWLAGLEQNMQFVADGGNLADLPNIGIEPMYQWFIWIGGSGGTIGLVIASLLIAKSKYLKSVNKVVTIPSIFNINEPVIFGFPIVMNPILVIPFILGPILVTLISFAAINLDLVYAPSLLAPWTLPAPIGAFISTQDWRAVVLCVINILVLTIVYLPFVKMYDKQLLLEESR